jgi:hypothetical protein
MMPRHATVLLLLPLLGCAGGATTSPTPAPLVPGIPQEERPPAWAPLRALAGDDAREGVLQMRDGGVELSFRRGDSTRPFVFVENVPDPMECWQEPFDDSDESEIREQSSWWIFHDAEDAVALEFTADDVGAWFWDSEKNCAVRVPAIDGLEVNDVTPPEYYKADDVQVGFRWHYTYREETGPMQYELAGDERVELGATEGLEQLIAERDAVAILAADGHALLQNTFDVPGGEKCYNSQISVFREPDGGLYAITTWEWGGVSCSEPATEHWFENAIAQWRPGEERFVTMHRTTERVQPLGDDGELKSNELQFRYPVEGGELVVEMHSTARDRNGERERCAERDQGSGGCVAFERCLRWESTRERQTTYQFVAADGPRIELGSGRRGQSEGYDECSPAYP